ncbi:MAG: hypothetical protein IPG53_17615 [Ignavibacteriales bacterium]|nr:hypothetical protein [Ignavibacteriales bacterium]
MRFFDTISFRFCTLNSIKKKYFDELPNIPHELKEYPLITTRDITKLPEKVYYHRLIEWQKKGYLVRLGKNIFSFSDRKIDDHLLMLTANKMYSPSYISLEMALSFTI